MFSRGLHLDASLWGATERQAEDQAPGGLHPAPRGVDLVLSGLPRRLGGGGTRAERAPWGSRCLLGLAGGCWVCLMFFCTLLKR